MKKNVDYYKIKNKIVFNDGFELEPGKVVIFNFEDGELYNLQYEDLNTKRIFWSHKSNVKFKSSELENWSTSKERQYQTDLNEKWLDSTTNKENGQNNTDSKRNFKSSSKTNSISRKDSKNIQSGQVKTKKQLAGGTRIKKSSSRKTIKVKVNIKKTKKITKRTTNKK